MPKGVKFGGRKKGSVNKKTAEARNRAEYIIQLIEADFLEEDISQLTARDRTLLYSDLLEYVMPKLSRQELSGNLKTKTTIEIVRRKNSSGSS